jgi:hypothetical protein
VIAFLYHPLLLSASDAGLNKMGLRPNAPVYHRVRSLAVTGTSPTDYRSGVAADE